MRAVALVGSLVSAVCVGDQVRTDDRLSDAVRTAVILVWIALSASWRAWAGLRQVVDLGERAVQRRVGRRGAWRQMGYGGPLDGAYLEAHQWFLLEFERPVHGSPSVCTSAVLAAR